MPKGAWFVTLCTKPQPCAGDVSKHLAAAGGEEPSSGGCPGCRRLLHSGCGEGVGGARRGGSHTRPPIPAPPRRNVPVRPYAGVAGRLLVGVTCVEQQTWLWVREDAGGPRGSPGTDPLALCPCPQPKSLVTTHGRKMRRWKRAQRITLWDVRFSLPSGLTVQHGDRMGEETPGRLTWQPAGPGGKPLARVGEGPRGHPAPRRRDRSSFQPRPPLVPP